MLANHDQFSQQLRNRLKTTGMGLGLVRLLQDARRFEEASTTLYALEFGFQDSDLPSQESGAASCSSASASTRTEVAEMQSVPSSIA